jgi:hypothetical protein
LFILALEKIYQSKNMSENQESTEISGNFVDFIAEQLNDNSCTLAEAIGLIGQFHDTVDSEVLKAFPSLGHYTMATNLVRFETKGTVTNMQGEHKSGKVLWTHYLSSEGKAMRKPV